MQDNTVIQLDTRHVDRRNNYKFHVPIYYYHRIKNVKTLQLETVILSLFQQTDALTILYYIIIFVDLLFLFIPLFKMQ